MKEHLPEEHRATRIVSAVTLVFEQLGRSITQVAFVRVPRTDEDYRELVELLDRVAVGVTDTRFLTNWPSDDSMAADTRKEK